MFLLRILTLECWHKSISCAPRGSIKIFVLITSSHFQYQLNLSLCIGCPQCTRSHGWCVSDTISFQPYDGLSEIGIICVLQMKHGEHSLNTEAQRTTVTSSGLSRKVGELLVHTHLWQSEAHILCSTKIERRERDSGRGREVQGA